jgi:hypothetical protein
MTLAEEAQRYLAVVEFFRAEGCEPHWRSEWPTERAQPSTSPARMFEPVSESKKKWLQ